jgi:hypothetical protein
VTDDTRALHPTHGGEASGKDNDLILAFDASCGTCSLIARRTAEICGDRLSILSLSHPRVAKLRYEAFGPEAPWAPTLIDTRTSPPRAWTGKGMALRLATLIGPRRSWRVLTAVGAIRHEGRMPDPGHGALRISRARFLGGVPLAVTGAALLLGSPAQAATTGPAPRITATPSNSVNTRQLAGVNLFDSAISGLDSPDVQNVLDRSLANHLRTGTRVDTPEYQNDLGLIRYAEAGSTEISAGSSVAGACALVRSSEHVVGTNKAFVTAYVLPREGYALSLETYEREFDGVRTRARLWKTPDSPGGEFTLAGISINGSIPELLPAETSTTEVSAPQIRCGGCTLDGDWSEQKAPGSECGGGKFYDCAKAVGPCAACLTQCSSFGPVCIGCLISLCPFAYIDCCGGRVPTCYDCDIQ